jgi:hypothetical protein
MSSTDVSEVTAATAAIEIDGPPPHVHNPRPAFLEGDQTAAIIEAKTAELAAVAGVPAATAAAPEPVAAPADDALFDAGPWAAVPTLDGQASDFLTVTFAGTIKYEAADPEGQALFEKLTLGKSVTFQVEGVVAKKSGAWKLAGVGSDNEREVVTGAVGVKVETLYVPRPEDLI